MKGAFRDGARLDDGGRLPGLRFTATLELHGKAAAAFAALSSTVRKEQVTSIEQARTAPTRERRIEKALALVRRA